MDPFHERLARLALDAVGWYGFALAGGYAVRVHGSLNRMSSDVDLFAAAGAAFDFAYVVDVVIAAYRHEGMQVDSEMRNASYARLNVASGGKSAKVELGVDWRKNEPIRMAVGPVLPDQGRARGGGPELGHPGRSSRRQRIPPRRRQRLPDPLLRPSRRRPAARHVQLP